MMQRFDSLAEMMVAFPNEQAAIDHFRAIRWKNGAFCPHCESTKIYHFSDPRTHKCGDCRKRFSIKVGTIFEDSKVPLQKWFIAIWLVTSQKKGIASTQLAKDISVTQKTAWFMLHRLRYAAQTKSFNHPLDGDIEADVTFVVGREKNKHNSKKLKAGLGDVGKNSVLGVKQRDGQVRFEKVSELTSKIANGIESALVLLKRQIIDIYHFVFTMHFQCYLDELIFRRSHCNVGEENRVNLLLPLWAGSACDTGS